MQQLIPNQLNAHVPVNENFATLDWASVYGNDPQTTAGLHRGYLGGRWGGFDVVAVDHTFGASTTTYVCVDLADGTLNFSTSDTNYLDTANFAPVETVPSGASSIVAADVIDDRTASGGVWNRAGVAGVGDMVLADAQTVTGAKTFGAAGDVGKLKIAGSTSGAATLDAPAVAGSIVITLPATTGTLALVGDITAAISAVINSAPGALDTLEELAAALGDDANFAATVTAALALKVGNASVNVFSKNQSVAPVALTDAATIATDASLSNNFTLTMVTTGRVMGVPTNPTDGMVCNWAIDSGAGGFTMTWASAFDFGGAGAPTHSVAASVVDLVSAYYHGGTSKWIASFRKGS